MGAEVSQRTRTLALPLSLGLSSDSSRESNLPWPPASTAQHACHSPQAGGTTLGEDLLTVSQNVLRLRTGLDTKNEEVC